MEGTNERVLSNDDERTMRGQDGMYDVHSFLYPGIFAIPGNLYRLALDVSSAKEEFPPRASTEALHG